MGSTFCKAYCKFKLFPAGLTITDPLTFWFEKDTKLEAVIALLTVVVVVVVLAVLIVVAGPRLTPIT